MRAEWREKARRKDPKSENARRRAYYLRHLQEQREKGRLRHAETYVHVLPVGCKRCGAEKPSRRHWYCEDCKAVMLREQGRREQKAKRASDPVRYGYAHQQLRKSVAQAVEAGGVSCWRCGELIAPGSPWHLGHDDADRDTYRGAEHARCNTSAAGKIGHRKRYRDAAA